MVFVTVIPVAVEEKPLYIKNTESIKTLIIILDFNLNSAALS